MHTLDTLVTRVGRPVLVLVILAGLAGCDGLGGSGTDVGRLQSQIDAQKKHITELEETIIALRQRTDDQDEQIATLQARGQLDPAMLIVPVRIELERLSGGYDEDGQPGDDGVVAYVQPIDADGHVIKAAGAIEMSVFDLTEPTAPKLITQAKLDEPNTRQAWHGRFMTNHFTVKCPWAPPDRKPPANRGLTIRVQFTDYLTGKTLTAETSCTIKLPADAAGTQ
ncbi:MAG: hypothetical protein JXA69_02270 [Phycisphaerae bacterium]|nr:hypothetical protein [Phycisphaerae bacterium]